MLHMPVTVMVHLHVCMESLYSAMSVLPVLCYDMTLLACAVQPVFICLVLHV